MKAFFFYAGDKHKDLGLFVLRLGIGVLFMVHGGMKLAAGQEMWAGLGGAMGYLGISFAPAFWGFMAAFTEFFGGLCLVLGLLTRPMLLLLMFTMIIAVTFHLAQGDAFSAYSHPLKALVVFIALFITGPGGMSIDSRIGGSGQPAGPRT